MRLALLGLFHEANTFSPLKADRALFASGGVFRGKEIVDEYGGSSTTIGGHLAAGERLGVDVVPLTFAFVNPVGAVTEDAFEWLAGEMLGELANGGPWDGVLLNLHGAAVAEHLADADAELARRVRAVVGPGVPVGTVLDLHGNASPALVDALTVTLAYQTNPHVDAAVQGARCVELVVRAARGEIAPVQVLVPLPVVVNIARQDTGEEPMASLVAAAERVAARPGMLWAGVIEGFPYADVPHVGMSCLTVHDGDRLAAEWAAWELADAVWSRRDDLQASGHTVEEALDVAEREHGPVVLLDVGDNIGAGAPGDSTVLLAAAVRRGLRSLVQTLWDPDAAAACVAAGAGAEVTLSVGARHGHSAGAPVPVKGRVRLISDGRFEEPAPTHGGFRWFDMGSTAVLETADGPTLVLMSRQTMNTSRRQLTALGLDPAAFQVIVAKGVNGPRAAYAPIASRLVVVDTDGITAMGLDRFTYRNRRRPLYPFEPAEFPAGAAR
ncbi:M81 family peptidase [Jiangella aurantiaca]|uniref:M81 family peptidase n=1 Tax=Jiangella aurantiaca TaxID=2530373 RepID=A0A4R5AH53_9ACTN|nr:M81 family metallopeptidase [Jiangella aurantiaca]TDD70750.1 M81 family peptidase [Jiangella aurantiaca]